MSIDTNKIKICSSALIAIGAEAITSFEEGTTEAQVASAKYENAKRDLLAIYPWTFNKCDTRLAQLKTDDLAKYKYLFEKPTDFLRALTLKDERGCNVDYTFRKGKINTDCENPILTYSSECAEVDMPPYFVSLLVDRLARDFLIPVTGKNDNYGIFDKIYQNNLALAKSSDAQSKTVRVLDTSALIGVR